MPDKRLETRPADGLFVCGTGTDVGKTYVSCEISKKLVTENISVGVYKPVASGAMVENGQLVSTDAVALQRSAECDDLSLICPQVFEAPLAPSVALPKQLK